MVVGVLQLELILDAPQSLKEKRGMVKKALGRCRVRFPVSCAETGCHDLWQRSQLGFSMVDHDQGRVHRVFDQIEEEIESLGIGRICDRFVEFLHYSQDE